MTYDVSSRLQQTPARLIRWLAAGGVLVVLLVTTTSALLRVSSAGLGCEDWPACYGRQAAGSSDQSQAPKLVRFLHRIGASAAGAVVLGIGLLAVTQPRRHRRELWFFAVLALLTLGLATLGRSTPGALVPAVAMGNVLGGMLMASLLAWLALGKPSTRAHAPFGLPGLCALALGLAFLAVGLGVMTSASYSGLACPGFPMCTSGGGPSGWAMVELNPWRAAARSPSIHMAHRCAALLVAAAMLVLAWNLGRLGRASRRLRNLLLAALTLQLFLGIGLVKLGLPLPVAVLHNLGAALLLLALVATQHHFAGRGVPSGRCDAAGSAAGPAASGC